MARRSRIQVVGVVLAVGAGLGVSLSARVTQGGATPEYIGAERCGACHQVEYQQWRSTGHATALERLSRVQQRDPTCRGCHTMSAADEDPALAGVQCESCHGPGSLYAPRYVMRDKDLAKLLGLSQVTDEQCATCHAKDTPSVRDFKFEDKLARVIHKAKDEPKKKQSSNTPREETSIARAP